MARLLIHVEGQTEEMFVNQILREHLTLAGFHGVTARLLGNSRERNRRVGIKRWESARNDIVLGLKQDPTIFTTTIVDYYGMPPQWPGRQQASTKPYSQRAEHVETAMLRDISSTIQHRDRFIPFVMKHEFEALLFSDCDGFSRAVGKPAMRASLQEIRDRFPSPEDINDDPETAPSKRIQSLFPAYQKPLDGPNAAHEIGLKAMRQACPHFHNWLSRLEALI